jgi:hypothetical protein
MWFAGGEIGGACTCRPPRSRAAREREYSHSLHDPRFLSLPGPPSPSLSHPIVHLPRRLRTFHLPIICATLPLPRSSVSCLPPSYPTSRPLIRPFSQWRLGGAWRPIRHLTTPSHSHLRFSSPWVTSRSRSNLSRVPSRLWVVPYSRYGAFQGDTFGGGVAANFLFWTWDFGNVSSVLVILYRRSLVPDAVLFVVGQCIFV